MSRELALPGRTVIGLDLSEHELALAADRGPEPWIRADGLQLPIKDECIDVVTSSMGLVVQPLSELSRRWRGCAAPAECWPQSCNQALTARATSGCSPGSMDI